MAQDLLSTIRAEIAERMDALRPLLAEHEQLLIAAQALQATHAKAAQADVPASTAKAPRARRAKRVEATPEVSEAAKIEALDSDATEAEPENAPRARTTRRSPSKTEEKPARAARGAAREAILAALEHGSHTVGELAVVTAMSGPNINGNLRRLAAEGAIVKTEREGKAAWTLADARV